MHPSRAYILLCLPLAIQLGLLRLAASQCIAPPTIATEKTQTEVFFEKKDGRRLECTLHGIPSPSYTWRVATSLAEPYRNLDFTSRYLTSQYITSGIYQCLGTNDCGTAVQEFQVTISHIENFKPRNTERIEVEEGSPAELVCDPPGGIPYPYFFWTIVPDYRPPIFPVPVVTSNRLNTDNTTGNLVFANVHVSDSDYYTCNAKNSYRELKFSKAIELRVKGSYLSNKHGPSIKVHPPEHVQGMRGKSLRLECIATGRPTPEITWTRVGEPIRNEVRKDSYGLALVFDELDFNDRGTYRCTAVSNGKTDFRTTNVTVKAAPYWQDKPHDVNVSPGNSSNIHCAANGDPQPQTKWLVNGEDINGTEITPRVRLEGNTVMITNAEEENDTMVLQCISKNMYGQILTNVILNTIDPCIPNPCKHGGECVRYKDVSRSLEFMCDCSSSIVYGGPTCEDPLKPKWASWASWSGCDVTCGGGQQHRNRTCMDPIPSDSLSCVGQAVEQLTCADWECPDCNRQCDQGSLNEACDACDCTDSVLHGRVTDLNNRPLSNVSLAYADTPYNLMATTNSTGFFNIRGVCPENRLMIVSKYQYATVVVNITKESSTSGVLNVALVQLELPVIVEHPRNKFRSVGDSVAFCCRVKSSSPLKRIEWFKDGDIVESATNDTFVIDNLTLGDSGLYRCRITTDAGAVFSSAASLSISKDPHSWCASTPLPNIVALPFDCVQQDTGSATYDLGTCPVSQECGGEKQIQTECLDTESYCCGVSKREDIQVVCSGYTLTLERVTECGCRKCHPRLTTLSGSVIDYVDNKGIKFIGLYKNGNVMTRTNRKGEFEISLNIATNQRVSITFKDDLYGKYEEQTKVFDVISGSAIVDVIRLRSLPDPIIFQSSYETAIPLGRNDTESYANIVIPPNDIYTSDGQRFDGVVKAFTSVVDIRNSTDIEFTQGDFTAIDDNGEIETLQTFGMFSVSLKDEDGNPLNVGGDVALEVNPEVIPMDMRDTDSKFKVKLWKLNKNTGTWEAIKDLFEDKTSGRSKRQRPGRVLFDGIGFDKFNVDKTIPSNEVCYVKAVAYLSNSNSGTKVWIESQAREKGTHRFSFKDQHEVQSKEEVCTRIWCVSSGRYTNYISATTSDDKIIPPTEILNVQLKLRLKLEACPGVEVKAIGEVYEVYGPRTDFCQVLHRSKSDCEKSGVPFQFGEITFSENYDHVQDQRRHGYSIFHPISDFKNRTRRAVENFHCERYAERASERFCFMKTKIEIENVSDARVIVRGVSSSSSFTLIGDDSENFSEKLPVQYGFRDDDNFHNFINIEYKCNGYIYWPRNFNFTGIKNPNSDNTEICRIARGTTLLNITVILDRGPYQKKETMTCSISNPRGVFSNINSEEKKYTIIDIPTEANNDDGVYDSGSEGSINVALANCDQDNSREALTLRCRRPG